MLSLQGLCYNKNSSRFSTVKYDTLNQNKLFDDLTQRNGNFDDFIYNEIENWAQFHEYWMSPDREIPVYIVRYEELLLNTHEVLKKII